MVSDPVAQNIRRENEPGDLTQCCTRGASLLWMTCRVMIGGQIS